MTTITAYFNQESFDRYMDGEFVVAWSKPEPSLQIIIQLNVPVREIVGVEVMEYVQNEPTAKYGFRREI